MTEVVTIGDATLYFDIACDRIEAAQSQGRLFHEVEAKPEQGVMI